MSDLIAFLTARLDEDEAYLRSCRSHPWTLRPFREVAAKRAILAEHHPTDWTAYGDHMCFRCVLDDDEPRPDDHHWLPYPCPTVRAVASIYSDRPDYQQEWEL